jgi:hypothetical protein
MVSAGGVALALVEMFADLPYIAPMNAKPDPIVSEFDSPEDEAAYDEWFRKKVAESLADPRPPVPHAEAMAQIRKTIEAARRKAC